MENGTIKEKRQGIIDLWKFIVAMVIMAHHLYVIVGGWLPWRGGWIYCEFFYIITGYYTCRHFMSVEATDRPKAAMEYIIRKFSVFFPYTTAAVILTYIIKTHGVIESGIKDTIYYYMDLPFEILYIRIVQAGHLWFLSAMLLAFPLFTMFVQIRNKYAICMVSILYSVWYYYSTYDLHSETSWKRALAGLMLGAFIYSLRKIYEEEKNMSFAGGYIGNMILMTLTETLCMILPMIYSFFTDPNFRICILLFVIGLGIMFSGISYTARLNGDIFSYLGKLSMPIYIWHPTVADAITLFDTRLNDRTKLIVYFAGTIMVSVISVWIVENMRKKERIWSTKC